MQRTLIPFVNSLIGWSDDESAVGFKHYCKNTSCFIAHALGTISYPFSIFVLSRILHDATFYAT